MKMSKKLYNGKIIQSLTIEKKSAFNDHFECCSFMRKKNIILPFM